MSEHALQNSENGTPAVAEHAPTYCYTPRVDLVETNDAFVLFADVPGVKPEDLDISFENGELTLHARCAPTPPPRGILSAEYGVGDYFRTFNLGDNVDSEKATAELKQGVLTLRLPKPEAVKPRRIAVQGA